MAYTIIPLTLAQLPDYKAIRFEALRTEPSVFSSDYAEESVQNDDYHALRLHIGPVYGAYDGAKIIGMTGVILYREKNIEHKAAIWGVYVTPSYRGKGIARQLMDGALRDLPSSVNQVRLGLEVNNEAARKLYESMGFEPYGVEKDAFQKAGRFYDETLMVKFL